jgi:hypothetical protein
MLIVKQLAEVKAIAHSPREPALSRISTQGTKIAGQKLLIDTYSA